MPTGYTSDIDDLGRPLRDGESGEGWVKPRPFWRWWVFCAALWLDVRFSWAWSRRLWAWACGPRSWWIDGSETVDAGGTEPF